MDLFLYNPTYEIWICTAPRCQYVVPSTTLITHIRTRYPSHPNAATPALQQEVLTAMRQRPWVTPPPEGGGYRFPPSSSFTLPGLPVFQGRSCARCGYISRTQETMRKHYYQKYLDREERRGRDRQSAAQTQVAKMLYYTLSVGLEYDTRKDR
ncbi:hypothetical protein FE257_006856 [Aspergillus nanangensis]|uniref:Uncharacterized protein n=1 Tax=Aspergillus nanangensis TaxID=2582783 RepID=A0AAD4CB57_ASPNN|nr:hypothetical protein FE257_006856 [Aspergillus nanangensis]